MERVPEPELMDEAEQARAYAEADFAVPHERFVDLYRECFPGDAPRGWVLDLGCGPGDVSRRFARAFPGCRIHGVDGAPAMLEEGARLLRGSPEEGRIRFHRCRLPGDPVPREDYVAVISNSLLHHLHDPRVLWDAVRAAARPGTPVFVMDLMRPESRDEARGMMETYAAGEPEVLREDFYNSLLAAFTPGEVAAQLREAGLADLRVQAVSDRHLIAWGRAGPG